MAVLRSQRVPRDVERGFTEHGVIQAANVLNSPHAVETRAYVVRAFVELRELLASNKSPRVTSCN